MGLSINGVKVAGVGLPGKTAYQHAVDAGYSGSEADFNIALASMAAHILDKENSHEVTAEQVGAYSKTETDAALENLKKEIGVQYAFDIDANGHLIMSYTDGATPPDVTINNDGHLILTI